MGKLLKKKRFTVDCKTGCWNWLLSCLPDSGYGLVWSAKYKKMIYAHREAYEAVHGPIADELEIDHLCRNTSCVNPQHLEAVTSSINRRRQINCYLTVEKVREIRELYVDGFTVKALKHLFEYKSISSVVHYRLWKDVK